MIDYKKTIEDLRNADNLTADHKLLGICERAAAAIEALQAEVKDLNEALKVESKARDNAEAKRYCYNCAHMDASMYDEAWYGICKLNDFEVEAIHGWGCTDWAKMEVQE